MPRIHLRQAIQDETSFRQFVMTSPRHGVVLQVVKWALVDLAKRIGSAKRAHDIAAQQSLLLKTKYLVAEAHDRTYIRQEHALIQAVEHFYDTQTVEHILAAQARSIQEAFGKHREINGRWSPLASGGSSDWTRLSGNGNVTVALSLRACRFRIYELTSQAQHLYHNGLRHECWAIKHRAEAIRADLAILANVTNTCSTYRILRDQLGQNESSRLLEWARSNTYLGKLERLLQECRKAKFSGRIETRANQIHPAIRIGTH